MPPAKTSIQKSSKTVAADGDGLGFEDVTAAFEQLQANKKTPGFIKILMNYMFSF